jgi:6-phosphogluconolactonase
MSVTTSNQQPDESLSPEYRLSRRELLPLVGVAAMVAALGPASLASAQGAERPSGKKPGAQARFVYVGTYTAPNTAPGGTHPSTALGIYVFALDPQTGGLTLLQIVENIPNPSWVTLDPQNRVLYASSEVSTWKGVNNSGGLTAYSVDPTTGKLTVLNDQPTLGAIPAHVTVDPSGKYALVANYIGANFTVLPIQSNGSLSPATDVFAVTGTGPNPQRQEAPHPHQIQFDPAAKFVFGNDLGTDKVWTWILDYAAGKLVPNGPQFVPPPPPYAQVAGGSGPRHTAFHPSGKFAYVIDEMVSSITAFTYDVTHGTMIWRQTVSTLPPKFTGISSCAEIVMHPSGKFVYGSNRGHNSIVGFAIDQNTGMLTVIEWTSTQGGIPRSFNIDPSGALLLAGNQDSGTIVPFSINPKSGKLKATGQVTNTPTPVCIQFGPTVP